MNLLRNAKKTLVLSYFILTMTCQPGWSWCVLNDSVLPLAVLGQPESQSTKDQIESLKAEIKCREQKKNETMQDDFYRYNFFGLDND